MNTIINTTETKHLIQSSELGTDECLPFYEIDFLETMCLGQYLQDTISNQELNNLIIGGPQIPNVICK